MERFAAMLAEAEAIHREDVASCRRMGELGAEDVPDGAVILTHCNAGALATGGYGTALGVIRAAHEQGKGVRVLADETRPYLQGARLTAWELQARRIPVEVITDNMAGHFFQRGEIQFVVVGSDRIAANADVANKIGTYHRRRARESTRGSVHGCGALEHRRPTNPARRGHPHRGAFA